MNYITSYDINIYLLEFYLFFSLCLILLFGVIFNSNKKKGHPIMIYIINFLVIQIVIFGLLIQQNNAIIIMKSWNNMLISNLYISNLKTIIILVFLSWLFLSLFYIKEESITSFEYNILTTLGVIGTLFVLQANDLLSIYLSIEFQNLVFYILVSFKRTSEFSTEASLKYFILGSFSSSLFLLGSSFLYTITGITNFEQFTQLITGFSEYNVFFSFAVITSILFMLSGILFKLGAAPFHVWLPDVYEGGPTITTVFLILMPKISLVILLFKILILSFQDYFYFFEKILILAGILSLFLGASGALNQVKWKKFIAYSSITNIGFILFGYLSNNNFSFFCIIFYTLIYLITTIALFSFVISFRKKNFFKSYQLRYINDIIGLSILNPVLSLTQTTVFFSVAGIPPFIGFFAKSFILLDMLQNQIYGTSILVILLSCVTCFYYIRVIKTLYFVKTKRLPFFKHIENLLSLLISVVFFFLTLTFLELDFISLFLQKLTIDL